MSSLFGPVVDIDVINVRIRWVVDLGSRNNYVGYGNQRYASKKGSNKYTVENQNLRIEEITKSYVKQMLQYTESALFAKTFLT